MNDLHTLRQKAYKANKEYWKWYTPPLHLEEDERLAAETIKDLDEEQLKEFIEVTNFLCEHRLMAKLSQ